MAVRLTSWPLDFRFLSSNPGSDSPFLIGKIGMTEINSTLSSGLLTTFKTAKIDRRLKRGHMYRKVVQNKVFYKLDVSF